MDISKAQAMATRALADTSEHVWFDVKFGCVCAVAIGVLSAIVGLPSVEVTALALTAYGLVFAGFYLLNVVRAIRHPDRNRRWIRVRDEPINSATSIWLQIQPTEPLFVGRNACEVTHPDGAVWLEPNNPDERPQLTSGLRAVYPEEFPEAPPVIPGTYKIRWLLGRGKGR